MEKAKLQNLHEEKGAAMANLKTNYEYHVPSTVDETLSLLEKYGADCKLMAGGTDMVPKIKAGVFKFDHLISLKKLDSLKEIHFDPSKGITIGSMVALRQAEAHPAILKYYPALYQGMHSMANTQVRNRGTIAGNICNAVPSADTAPPLLAYDAVVNIVSKKGRRSVPADRFFTGVCRTVLEPEELVTDIFIPLPDERAFSLYDKYAVRKALDLAMIGAAVNVTVDSDKVVQRARIALGAVAAVPKRALEAEALIQGKKLTEELILEAAAAASQRDCSPISDLRASADYRRRMVFVHVRDALRKVVEA